jgi:hypothetical protein
MALTQNERWKDTRAQTCEEEPHFTSWQTSTPTVKICYSHNHFLANKLEISKQPTPQATQTNFSSTLGLPLVRHPPNPPIPPPHPPTPRRPRPNLEHRILQRTALVLFLPPHSLGENPASAHSQLRRLAAAFPTRAVAQSLRRSS